MSEAFALHSPKTSRTELILNRILWSVIILLILFFIAEIIFHFIISPQLVIKNIIVKSNIPLSEEEILSIAGIGENEYYFSLNPEKILSNLEAYPLIHSAVVEKVFPDTLNMTIFGRKPLMMALTGAEGRSIPMVLDEEGVIFQISKSITDWDLPVISGLEFKDIRSGMELPEMLKPLLLSLKKIRKDTPDLFRLISEVRIIPKSNTSYELLLYPITYSIKVRFGRSITGSGLKNAVIILDLIEKQGLSDDVEELDLRTGELVYRIKER